MSTPNANGWQNYLHCFLSLSPEQNIATLMNLIKGESSHWANRNLAPTFMSGKFGWQDEYFAVSVSQSHFALVNNYISGQEEHHRKKTFRQEYLEFLKKFDVPHDERYLFECIE